MELPQEIEVWYIIPALRRELAMMMKAQGLKQKEIAEKLDITEPAVSQYIKNKRAKTIRFNKKVTEEIKKSSGRIASGKTTNNYELQRILDMIRREKILCELHRMHTGLPHDCKLCDKA
jgi:uncharacterized protein